MDSCTLSVFVRVGCSRWFFWRAKEPINQKRHARVHVDEKPNPIVIHQLLSEKGRCKILTLKTWENGSLPLAFILHHHTLYYHFTYRYPHLGSRTNYLTALTKNK